LLSSQAKPVACKL